MGTKGTVIGVDDVGSLLMRWDTGLTNMFDIPMVHRMAHERDYYELVSWIEDHRVEYVRFIMYGDK